MLATGCRERPRSARLVPGSRPEGVYTTGLLQQLAQKGLPVGTRALVVGAEHVSYSAVLTLAHAGAKAVGMTTELDRHQTLAIVHAGAALRYRVPLWTRTAVAAIHGHPRVEEVELRDLDTGATRRVACDTVVFTAGWIPDHELAAALGLELDSGTRGPLVDAGLRTARPGLFAAGNLLHGAEPADVAALSGRRAAASVAAWLSRGSWPGRLRADHLPPAARLGLAERREHHARRAAPRPVPRSARPPSSAGRRSRFARTGGLSGPGGVRRVVPGRSASLPSRWLDAVDPAASR